MQLCVHFFFSLSMDSYQLPDKVDSIRPASANSHDWTLRSNLGSANYKAVIIAASLHSSGIKLPPTISSQVPEYPPVHWHVTVLSTTAQSLNPEYFALSPSTRLPKMILTTSMNAHHGGNVPEFYSISYIGLVRDGEWAVKIVSKDRLSDDWLSKVFSGQIGWVHRKEVGNFCFLYFLHDS